MAEWAVLTFKGAMRNATTAALFKEALRKATPVDLETRISRFLFQYRLTPHSTTGISPAELLLGRRPRSCLDLMQPNVAKRVHQGQNRQKLGQDQQARGRQFALDDPVFVRNFTAGSQTWWPGTVVSKRGPLSLDIQLKDGQVLKRHIDHVQVHSCKAPQGEQSQQLDDLIPFPMAPPAEGRTNDEPVTPVPQVALWRST